MVQDDKKFTIKEEDIVDSQTDADQDDSDDAEEDSDQDDSDDSEKKKPKRFDFLKQINFTVLQWSCKFASSSDENLIYIFF